MAATIFDIEKLLPFHYYLTDRHQICGNIGTSTWNISMTSEMHKCIVAKIQDGDNQHLIFRKTVAISLLFDQSSPILVGISLL